MRWNDRSKKVIGFIAIAIAMFMGTLDSTIVNVALPDITKYFHAALNDASWISTIYVLGLAIFMITGAKLADQFGRKRLMLTGLFLFGMSSALCGCSRNLVFLIGMRFIQSIGGAIITPIVIPMGLEIFGKENTQKVAGMLGAVTALAAAGGPPIGGLLIQCLNWQAIFFVNVPFAVLAFILTSFFVDETYDETTSKKIDWLGMLSLTLALFFLTFALLKGNDFGWKSFMIIGMFTGAAVFSALFVLIEKVSTSPMVELGLFRERTFTASTLCYMASGFGVAGPMLIFSYFLQNAMGYSVLKASFVVMTMALTVVVFMPLGTVIAVKTGAAPVNFLGVMGMGIGTYLLSRVGVDTSRLIMMRDMSVCGFGLGFSCQSLVSSIRYLPQEKSGMGSGIVNAARQIGTCIGIAVLVTILDAHVANARIEIRNKAVSDIRNSSAVADDVKQVMTYDIQKYFTEQETKSENEADSLENIMAVDIRKTLTAEKQDVVPAENSSYQEIYHAAGAINDGAEKALAGQKKMDQGIKKLASGSSELSEAGQKIDEGMTGLSTGLAKTETGAEKLSKGMEQLEKIGNGIDTLSAGLHTLSLGTDALSVQFQNSASGTTTLKDGIDHLDAGAQSISQGAASLNEQFQDGSADHQTLKYKVKALNTAAQAAAAQFSQNSSSNLAALVGGMNASSGGVSAYVSASQEIINVLRKSDGSGVYSTVMNELLTASDDAEKQSLAKVLLLITNTDDQSEDVVLTTSQGNLSVTQMQATAAILGSEGYGDEEAVLAVQSDYEKGGKKIEDGMQILGTQFRAGASDGNMTLCDALNAVAGGTSALNSQMSVTGGKNTTLADGITSLNNGAQTLAAGTRALDVQMSAGVPGQAETLYDKINSLNQGTQKLSQGASGLSAAFQKTSQLRDGSRQLASAMIKLKKGSDTLQDGSRKLENGLKAMENGAGDLSAGSGKLTEGTKKLADGTGKLKNGISKAAQKQQIESLVSRIKKDKDQEIASAFSKTFLVSAALLILVSWLGFLTDKRKSPLKQ